MSLSPRSRWSWSATMITTWTDTLAGMAILTVTGSGWILYLECTNCGHSVFFCCIAELAIKPCRSSRSKLRGEFGIPNTCKTGNKNTTKQQTPPNPKHNTKQKTGKCLECETQGEKRVKRPKRPNALICRTPGGSMRYPLSSSLGMMLISHSVVSIPASPSRFAI